MEMIADAAEKPVEDLVLLSIKEICDELGIKERAAYNFVNNKALRKESGEDGEVLFAIPREAWKERLQRKEAQVHKNPLQLHEKILYLQEQILAVQAERDQLQAENMKLQSDYKSLNNQIATHHDVIQRRKEEQAELEALRKRLELANERLADAEALRERTQRAEEELKRIPAWLIHLLRMLNGDKL